jgi:phage FluMu protein Com
MDNKLQNIYCKKCKKLIGKQRIDFGEIELSCRHCKTINYLVYSSKIIEDFLSSL